jgi:hypothetical protein
MQARDIGEHLVGNGIEHDYLEQARSGVAATNGLMSRLRTSYERFNRYARGTAGHNPAHWGRSIFQPIVLANIRGVDARETIVSTYGTDRPGAWGYLPEDPHVEDETGRVLYRDQPAMAPRPTHKEREREDEERRRQMLNTLLFVGLGGAVAFAGWTVYRGIRSES